MDNNFSESKRNLSRAPQETELGSVPVSQWPSPYKKQVRNLEFQLTSVSRGRVRPPLGASSLLHLGRAAPGQRENTETVAKQKQPSLDTMRGARAQKIT